MLSSIPSVHHMIDEYPSNVEMRSTSQDRDADKCQYEFRPANPIGWVMMNGNPSKDRFADDPMSSTWTPGKLKGRSASSGQERAPRRNRTPGQRGCAKRRGPT